MRCQADHLALQLFVDHAVSQIAVCRRFVGALGETLALLAQLDVTFLGQNFQPVFLVTLEQTHGAQGRTHDLGCHFRLFRNQRLGRGQAALDGAVVIGARGDFAEALVLGEKSVGELQHNRVDHTGAQGHVRNVTAAEGKKGHLIGGDLIGREYLPNDNFRQAADTAVADFFTAQLLDIRDARVAHQIEGRPLAHRHDDAHVGAAYRGAHGGAGCRAEVDAASEHPLHRQTGFKKNDLGVDSLIAEEAALRAPPRTASPTYRAKPLRCGLAEALQAFPRRVPSIHKVNTSDK